MTRWASGSLLDLRHSVRGLRRRPLGTMASALTLGLGIGSTLLVGSLARVVLLDPLPYPDSHRLVEVVEMHQGRERRASPAGYLDWRRGLESFSHLAAYRASTVVLETAGALQRREAAVVSGNFFQTLGVDPVFGRSFGPAINLDGVVREVVLGHGLWSELGRREDLLGSSLRVDGELLTVVGIAPPDFAFPDGARLWIRAPHEVPPAGDMGAGVVDMRDAWYFDVVGRLAPTTSLEGARRDARMLALELRRRYPADAPDQGLVLRGLKEATVAGSRPFLLLLLAACSMLLVATCANVAALSLVRWLGERRDLKVRAALGSSGWRNARLVALRSSLICGVGGLIGVLGAGMGVPALRAWLPSSVPRLEEIRLQGDMLWLGLAVTVVATVLCAALPARDAARLSGSAMPSPRNARSGRGVAGVVALEVALAVVLLSSTVLLARSVMALTAVDAGFRPEGVLTMQLDVPVFEGESADGQLADWRALLDGVRTVSGVSYAALSSETPTAIGARATARVEGPDGFQDGPDVAWRPTSPEWFQAMGMDLIRGRGIQGADARGTRDVVVVDEAFARVAYGDGADPLGRRVSIGLDGHDRPLTIVGVVSSTRNQGMDREAFPVFYRPLSQVTPPLVSLTLAVRVRPGGEREALASVQEALGGGGVIVHGMSTGKDLLLVHGADRRFLLQLLAAFAAMALILGAVGVYAVATGLVAARTREIGVRRAIGAGVDTVVRDVLVTGAVPVGLGLVLGLVGALAVGQVLRGLLYGVGPADPVSLLVVVVVLAVTALWALSGPALRAARVDPAVALRAE